MQVREAQDGRAPVVFAAGVVATLFVFLLIAIYFYHFPFLRGDERDTNIFIDVFWRNDLALSNLYPDLYAPSFHQVHFSPFLLLINFASYLAPMTQETFFAVVMGAMHAAFAVVFFSLFIALAPAGDSGRNTSPRGASQIVWGVAAAILAAAYALNGLVLQALWLGHYEFVIPLFIILLFVALARRDRKVSLIVFLLLLSTREDAGFHAFAFLSLWAAYRRFWGGASLRDIAPEALFALAGLVYSAFAIFVLFPAIDGGGAFATIFAGYPAWAHLSFEHFLLVARMHLSLNAHLYVPSLIIIAAAFIRRRPGYLVGVLATGPWIGVHAFAAHIASAHIYAYKAFPLMVTLIWPLIVEYWIARREQPEARRPARWPLAPWMAAIALTSFLSFDNGLGWVRVVGSRPHLGFVVHPCARDRSNYDAFRTVLSDMKPYLGDVRISHGVLRYAPEVFAPEEMIPLQYIADPSPPWPAETDTVIFYARGLSSPQFVEAATQGELRRLYAVEGTSIILASRRPLETYRLRQLLSEISADDVFAQCAP